VTQLAHLVRDRPGRVVALDVSTGRIKKMRFERTTSPSGAARRAASRRVGKGRGMLPMLRDGRCAASSA
jgi:16S rRNA C967 or C1407 C5-methylase (RsmB/RsmF family)